MLNNQVLTKSLLIERGLGIDRSCTICAHDEETPIHLFRDCVMVCNIWLALIPSHVHSSFFHLSFDEWVRMNCQITEFS